MARPPTRNDGAAMANDQPSKTRQKKLEGRFGGGVYGGACEAKRTDAGTVTQHKMDLMISPPDPDARRGRLTKMHRVR